MARLADDIPTFDQLFNPLLEVLRQLGGSASNSELEDKVASLVGLTEEQQNREYKQSTHFSYRLGWAKSYLKTFGLIGNSARGVWSLTEKGKALMKVDPDAVKRAVRGNKKPKEAEEPVENEAGPAWKDDLLKAVQGMEPAALERLCMLILREAGFKKVDVTGRSGDRGIDGRGVLQMNGLLSFHVIFQCKRWAGSVGPDEVRSLRGAMAGRADKGILLTTGRFTSAAMQEAAREGVTPIDLVDGELLCEKMREVGLGVKIEPVVDHEWIKAV
jgi:restriction system protein